jgi:N-acetylmuramoyl-L-alanine amidase
LGSRKEEDRGAESRVPKPGFSWPSGRPDASYDSGIGGEFWGFNFCVNPKLVGNRESFHRLPLILRILARLSILSYHPIVIFFSDIEEFFFSYTWKAPGRFELDLWDTIERGRRPLYGTYVSSNGSHISTLRLALQSGFDFSANFGAESRKGMEPTVSSRSILVRNISIRSKMRRPAIWGVAALLLGDLAMGLGLGMCRAQTPQSPAVAPAPQVSAPQVQARPPVRMVVVLDAAHGGEDGGGQVGASIAEKTVTLALSVRLRSLLTARGFQVVTTREGNVNLEPNVRAQIANHAGAGPGFSSGALACLSLHASQTGSGVHIFVSSLSPAMQGRFLAWKTAQAAFVARSLKLAGTVSSAFEHGSGGDAGSGSPEGGSITATLARTSLPVVDSMACPALAIEVAPMRDANGKVVTEVTDQTYQTQIAETLAAALLDWKASVEADSPHAGGHLP